MAENQVPIRIEGTITLANGRTVTFLIDHEYGWRKWGADNDTLYAVGELVEALNDAAHDHLVNENTSHTCGECGQEIPGTAHGLVNEAHALGCSCHPANVVDASS